LLERIMQFPDDGAIHPFRAGDAIRRSCNDIDPHVLHLHRHVRKGLGAGRHVRDLARIDRKSEFGRLDKALDAAAVNTWTVVSMKTDWKRIFAFA
jgi:hypothetical protein